MRRVPGIGTTSLPWAPEPGTPEGDSFHLLALVIEDYERKHWPIEPADAPEVVTVRIEDTGTAGSQGNGWSGNRQEHG